MDTEKHKQKKLKEEHSSSIPERELLADVKAGKEPLSVIVSRIAEFAYMELHGLADVIPGMEGARQCSQVKAYFRRFKSLFMKALVLVRFSAEHGDNLQLCRNLYSFLTSERDSIDICANAMLASQRSMHQFIEGPFDVDSAVDVLSTGTYTQVPLALSEMLVPPNLGLSTDKEESVRRRMSQQIEYRLGTYDYIPAAYRVAKPVVSDGRLKIHVAGMYTVYLTVSSLLKSANWRILALKWSDSLTRRPPPHLMQQLLETLQAALAEKNSTDANLRQPDTALLRLHDTLHTLTTRLYVEQWFADIVDNFKQDLKVRTAGNAVARAEFTAQLWPNRLLASVLHLFLKEQADSAPIEGEPRGQQPGFYLRIRQTSPPDHFADCEEGRELTRRQKRVLFQQQFARMKERGTALFAFEPFVVDRAGNARSSDIFAGFSGAVLLQQLAEGSASVWERFVKQMKQIVAAKAMESAEAQCNAWTDRFPSSSVKVTLDSGELSVLLRGSPVFQIRFSTQKGRFIVSAPNDSGLISAADVTQFEESFNVAVERALSLLLNLSLQSERKRIQTIAAALPELVLRTDVPLRASAQQKLIKACPAVLSVDSDVQWSSVLVYSVNMNAKQQSSSFAPAIAIAVTRGEAAGELRTFLWCVVLEQDADVRLPSISQALPVRPESTTDGPQRLWWSNISLSDLVDASSAVFRHVRSLPWSVFRSGIRQEDVRPRLYLLVENLADLPAAGFKTTSFGSLWPVDKLRSTLDLLQIFPVTLLCLEASALVRSFASPYLGNECFYLFIKLRAQSRVFSKLSSRLRLPKQPLFWVRDVAAASPAEMYDKWVHAICLQCLLVTLAGFKPLLSAIAPTVHIDCLYLFNKSDEPVVRVVSAVGGYMITLRLKVRFTEPLAAEFKLVPSVAFVNESFAEHSGVYTAILQSLVGSAWFDARGLESFVSFLLSVIAAWHTVWPVHAVLHEAVSECRKQLVEARRFDTIPACSVQSLCELQYFSYPLQSGISVSIFTNAVTVSVSAGAKPLSFATAVNRIYCADMADNPSLRPAATQQSANKPVSATGRDGEFEIGSVCKSLLRFRPLLDDFKETWARLDALAQSQNEKITTFSTGRVFPVTLFKGAINIINEALYKELKI